VTQWQDVFNEFGIAEFTLQMPSLVNHQLAFPFVYCFLLGGTFFNLGVPTQ